MKNEYMNDDTNITDRSVRNRTNLTGRHTEDNADMTGKHTKDSADIRNGSAKSRADKKNAQKKSDKTDGTELSDSWLSKSICSANDCTGLIPSPPSSEAELEAYEEMYPFVNREFDL